MTIPDSVEALGQDMSLVYEWCVNRVLINIARRFPYITDKDARGGFEWQAAKLAELGQVNQETMKIIRDSLGPVPAKLKKILEAEIIAAINTVEPELTEASKRGLLNGPEVVPEASKAVERELTAYYRQAADKLNLVNTVMLDSTEQAYKGVVADIAAKVEWSQQILDSGAGSVVTGVETLNSATRQAVARMVKNGLTGYIDHAGRRWRPEAYVMMDIRTTAMNTARQAAFDRCDDFGSDIIQVDAHAGARPLCYPWQGKLISRTNNSRDVEDLYGTTVHVYALQETSYGEPAGLFGINCRHFGTPFIPGFSGLSNPDLIQDKEENDARYQAVQEQRGMERAIRDARLRESVAKARGDKEQQEHWRGKVKEWSERIQAHCDEYGIPRRKDREYTPVDAKWPENRNKGPFAYNVEPYKGNAGNGTVQTAKDYFPNGTKPVANVAQQATTNPPEAVQFQMEYGVPFDGPYSSKAVEKQFAKAKATLDNAPLPARKAWKKVSGDLKQPSFDRSTKGAHYSRLYRRTFFKTYKEAFGKSSYQEENAVFFHEFGHNIDNLLGGGGDNYLSMQYNGGAFGKMLYSECGKTVKAFHAEFTKGLMPEEMASNRLDIGGKQTGIEFCAFINRKYTIYQRSDISDMFEKYMVDNYGIEFPFGVGHGAYYARRDGALPKEAFAEMYSAYVTDNESLAVIKELFPESYKMFVEMLEGATQ